MDWRLLIIQRIANIGIPLDIFSDSIIFKSGHIFWVFGLLQTSLLCIVRELAGGGRGAVTVAVGVSDM